MVRYEWSLVCEFTRGGDQDVGHVVASKSRDVLQDETARFLRSKMCHVDLREAMHGVCSKKGVCSDTK